MLHFLLLQLLQTALESHSQLQHLLVGEVDAGQIPPHPEAVPHILHPAHHLLPLLSVLQMLNEVKRRKAATEQFYS